MTKTPVKSAAADRMAAARAARAAKKAEAEAASTAAAAEGPAPAEGAAETAAADAELPAEPTTLEKVAINEEERRQAKIAALRAAKLAGPDTTVEQQVRVRVLKRGHGLISTGEHIGGLGELTYDHGETPNLPRSIAMDLEDRGLVEIE
jgi:regulator of protease activity HflC (stomatin/prohibitin superfamily)